MLNNHKQKIQSKSFQINILQNEAIEVIEQPQTQEQLSIED